MCIRDRCEAEPGNAKTQNLQWSLLGSSLPMGKMYQRGAIGRHTNNNGLMTVTQLEFELCYTI